MRNVARLSLSRLAPAFWVGAAVLVGLLITDPDWTLEAARGVISLLILLTAAAISGSVCRQIEKSNEKAHDDCTQLLLDALLDESPTRVPDLQRRLHSVGE